MLGLTWFVKEDCLAINSQLKDEHIVSKRTVPRHIGLDNKGSTKHQFLVFCDAQDMHLQQQSTYSKNVKISAELTSSSQKQDFLRIFLPTLVPNKKITIPRLELLAALIGTRCMKFVENELKVEICQKHIWLDSQCVLN